MDKAQESKKTAEGRAKNLGKVNTDTGFGAGAGGGIGLNRPGFGPSVKHFAPRASSGSQKALTINPDIGDAWKQIQDDTNPLSWLICQYKEGSTLKVLDLSASGNGGLNEFKTSLPADEIAWGIFRCHGVDKRGERECKRSKFVFVKWLPEGVSQIKKARTSAHKGEIKDCIDGAHLDMMAETVADLEPSILISKLQAATGAHKPNGYAFEDGEFLEADFYGLGIGSDCKGETSTGSTGT